MLSKLEIFLGRVVTTVFEVACIPVILLAIIIIKSKKIADKLLIYLNRYK